MFIVGAESPYNDMMELIDTHCHIDVDEFAADREQVLANCRQLGVTRFVVPGIEARCWESLLQLCRTEPGLYPALGLHPVYLDQHCDQDIQRLQQMLVTEQDVVAVGEIGLDYYLPQLDKERQQVLFESQLQIAHDADLPVILHVRKAHAQVLATLRRIQIRGGIVHAFNGSLDQAKLYIDMGFKLGFGGMLSYARSSKLRRLAAELPLSSIVLETDAPDMAGEKHKGRRNSPEYLPEYLQVLAEVRGEEVSAVAAATTSNACSVFKL